MRVSTSRNHPYTPTPASRQLATKFNNTAAVSPPAAFAAFVVTWAASGFFSPAFFQWGAAILAIYLALGLYYMLKGIPRFGLSMILFIPVALSVHLAYGFGTWCGAALSLARPAARGGS